jgi:hypothetical protein
MVDFSLNPAYNARAAAGQVQTPGLVDWSGLGQRLYDDLQAPYWRRQDREQGAAVADPMQLRYTAQPRFVAAMNQQQDPISVYAKSNYTAQPRFASASSVPALPNQPSGSVRVAKDSSRLPGDPNPYNGLAFGYDAQPSAPVNPAVQAIDAAAPTGPMFPLQMMGKGTNPTAAYGKGYTASMRFASPNAGKTGDGIIDLTASNPSERGAQGIADSQGAPVRVGQKVYYPGGKAPSGNVSGTLGQNDTRGPLSKALGLKTSGLGGLLGGLFGGGNGGGIFSGGLGSGAPSSIGTSPSQGQAMVVSPGTSTGSTLSSMGYSDGALVPAATIRNLESRGYFN